MKNNLDDFSYADILQKGLDRAFEYLEKHKSDRELINNRDKLTPGIVRFCGN